MDDPQTHLDHDRRQLRTEFESLNITPSISMGQFPVHVGWSADVYRGIATSPDEEQQTTVAIKVTRPTFSPSPEDRVRIVNRVRQVISEWRKLDHPNVQPLLGLWWDDDLLIPALVTRWEENGNLDEYITSLPRSTTEEDLFAIKLGLLEGALNGLAYLHSEGVVYGGIKSSNVLVGAEGNALLCVLGSAWASIEYQTILGVVNPAVAGTHAFAAPELLPQDEHGEQRILYTVASDVWSVGFLVCTLLGGSLPSLQIDELIPPEGLDPITRSVVDACCVFDPSQRPSVLAIIQEITKLRSTNSKDLDTLRNRVRTEFADLDLTTAVSLQIRFPVRGGGFTDVYRGVWVTPVDMEPVDVALKVVRPAAMPTKTDERIKALELLREEISIWRKLSHPNVQSLLGLWWNEDLLFPAIVSRWQGEGNILEYLSGIADFTSQHELHKLKMALLEGVVSAISFLHDNRVVHAHITGDHVLVSSQHAALLCYAGPTWSATEPASLFTPARSSRSIAFMAPELLAVGSTRCSAASDVWAFGCLVVQVFAGSECWNELRSAQIPGSLSRQQELTRPPTLDDRIWNLVKLCCSHDATQRPTPATILAILQNIRADDILESETESKRVFDGADEDHEMTYE